MCGMEAEELADAIKQLNAWAQRHAPEPEHEARRRLREHFGEDPRELPIVMRPLQLWDRPNLQVAVDAFLEGRRAELIGLVVMRPFPVGLGELARGGAALAGSVAVGAPEHIAIPLGDDDRVTCLRSGLWFVGGDDDERLAIMLSSADRGFGGEQISLEVMAPDRDRAEAVVGELWRLMNEHNVYRGRVLELRERHFTDRDAKLSVRSLPPIARDRIVLPEGVLERIERTTFGMSRHAERLRASGRHLRRGLLLHGPPGVGKTLTAMYLATHMPERTVVILTGCGLKTITPSVDLAKSLAPSIVILEDVDLVAMERAHEPTNAILFELLNAMDGLDADHDVLFVLTTNAPERIEPALASRPGRVDHAVELPLPDAAGRRRLVTLYGEGLQLAPGAFDDELIAELDGTSPAFIRELLRRSAVVAADRSEGELRVTQAHLLEAFAELRSSTGELTRTLLGDAAGD